MSALYFYDDVRARQFEPFALTRPGSELRAGTSLIRKRWERATSLESAGFISSKHLAHFEEGKAPPAVAPKSEIPAGSVIVNEGNRRFFEPAPGRNWLVGVTAQLTF